MNKLALYITLLCLFPGLGAHGQLRILIEDAEGVTIPMVHVRLSDETLMLSDENGFITIEDRLLPTRLHISHAGYSSIDTLITASDLKILKLVMRPVMLTSAVVEADANSPLGVRDYSILAAKKIDILSPSLIGTNVASATPRQLFAKVPGLNIFENGDGGMQLSIGGRGMNPNRSANFNTRQNGYDIAADPLGYPESYYAPTINAVAEIRLVRGAGSLQYGPQFGGMIDFKLLQPSNQQTWSVKSVQSLASFGTLSSFNALGYRKKNVHVMAYYQRRQGEGWRAHSAYASDQYYVSGGWSKAKHALGIEFTGHTLLAEQPGGLTDQLFISDPDTTLRYRNYFSVDWKLLAGFWEWEINSKLKIKTTPFALLASRSALGVLDKINRLDNRTDRDLIQGTFHNLGLESKMQWNYDLMGSVNTLIAGVRLFRGNTGAYQGIGTAGSDADFSRNTAALGNTSDYQFHNRNASLFIEQVTLLGERWSVIYGGRIEQINTSAEGEYTRVVTDAAGNILPTYPRTFSENSTRNRAVFLGAFGLQYRKEMAVIYSSIARNYRAINFTDIRVVNPNQVVDPAISDEKGFTYEAGVRENRDDYYYDLSFFYVWYADKIGNMTDTATLNPLLGPQTVQIRRNISAARISGIEARAGVKKEWRQWKADFGLNASMIDARYVNRSDLQTDDNFVEYAPRLMGAVNFRIDYRWFAFTWRSGYVSEQFTDATNSPFGSDPTAVVGEIPAYHVHDLSVSYSIKRTTLSLGVDNVLDTRYFTRRATAYPGPGIIPADPRIFHVSVAFNTF